ncbi:TPA: hypothetical protein ACOFQW_002842 [Staphylococcus aureus]|nr:MULTISPECIES: hypothetical protein [Staphylococcus]AMX46160.1 hypothetical protein A5J11_14090 [Staphylococcus aureus]EKZ8479506.1 hypothetical protein [Staphylococcus aureus]ELP3498769.1 hypothetical protein [Staphylococcus aureus]EUQ53827.1 hypothetical protein T813_02811 [Staphylococcus aureus SCLE6005]EVC20906.1 hypothetical protein T665_02876 [Staphylococcus aureus SJOS6053]
MENTNNLFERLEILTKPENIETTFFIILKFIIFIIILMIGALIVLGILNSRRNYNPEKIWNKRKIRTLKSEIGGGQEYYFRYWIWQRNKRKNILIALRDYSPYEEYYPSQKWLKKDKSKLPFRREIWVIK